jgi:hypothetical protein
MTSAPHDKAEQLRQIQDGLLEGEQIQAVYDCTGAGTGFVGVTDRRLILQDKSFVGKNVAITSVPFKQIRTVSMVSNKSWAGSFFSSSSVAIDVGGTSHIAEFRGQDKARHIHNLILWHLINN